MIPSLEEKAMNNRINIESIIGGRDGAFGAYISRPKTFRLPPWSFCRSCSA